MVFLNAALIRCCKKYIHKYINKVKYLKIWKEKICCECRYKNCNEKSTTFSFNGWNNFSKADLKRYLLEFYYTNVLNDWMNVLKRLAILTPNSTFDIKEGIWWGQTCADFVKLTMNLSLNLQLFGTKYSRVD